MISGIVAGVVVFTLSRVKLSSHDELSTDLLLLSGDASDGNDNILYSGDAS